MFIHEESIRVRYAETDQMGYVHHGNYASYYEIGRIEALRSLGIIYKDMEAKEGILLPVLDIQSKFLKPIFYDELITIRTYMRELPKVRMIFETEIYNEEGVKVHEARVTLVFVSKDTMKPCRAPEGVLEKMKTYMK